MTPYNLNWWCLYDDCDYWPTACSAVPIMDEDDINISKMSIVLDLYLCDTWPIEEGKSHLLEHQNTFTHYFISLGIFKKHIFQILLKSKCIWCVHFFRIAAAIETPQLMLTLPQDEVSIYSMNWTTWHQGIIVVQSPGTSILQNCCKHTVSCAWYLNFFQCTHFYHVPCPFLFVLLCCLTSLLPSVYDTYNCAMFTLSIILKSVTARVKNSCHKRKNTQGSTIKQRISYILPCWD